MTRFQKMQLYSSVIPFYSTLFIYVSTIVVMVKNKVDLKSQLRFAALFFSSSISAYMIYSVGIMLEIHIALIVLVVGAVLAVFNYLIVKFQCKCINANGKTINRSFKKLSLDNKKIKSNILSVLFLVVLCVGGFVLLSYTFNERTIEDTNGADVFELNTITTEEILHVKNNSVMSMISTIAYEGKQTNIIDNDYEEYDYDHVILKTRSFSGVRIAQATLLSVDTLQLEVNSNITSGNFKIVVMVDGEYYTNMEINKTATLILENISNKMVLVKIAGEDANMNIEITRKYKK